MNTRRLFTTALAFIASASIALAGQVGPYLYTFGSTPVDAPVTALNPPPGAVVIDTTTGVHYRKISAVGSNATYSVEATQSVVATTPLTGATITGSTSQNDEYNYITPAAGIAALTYVFPSNANSRIGQRITLVSTQIVTTLTLTKNSQTITNPAGTALAANVPQQWVKTAASVWIRISNVATDSGVVLTASVITDGLTASGSAANDFSASTGTFLTSTGANTLSGTTTVAANKNLVSATGTSALDFSLGTGVTKTTTGVFTIGGTTSLAANKNIACAAGTTAVDWSLGTGVTKTTTGVNTLGGLTVFKSIATPVAAAGSVVGDAAALGAANVIYVSSDSAAKGVKFATSAAGEVRWVINTSATACEIYAASGGTVNGGAADASVTIPASKGVLCFSTAADTWVIYDLPAKSS